MRSACLGEEIFFFREIMDRHQKVPDASSFPCFTVASSSFSIVQERGEMKNLRKPPASAGPAAQFMEFSPVQNPEMVQASSVLHIAIDAGTPAPAWTVQEWLNSSSPLRLEHLRGKVIALHAFQMLCPACVLHGLPQAQRIRTAFPESDVAVVGLHTVFEHHDVMTPAALRAFLFQFHIEFPVGIDEPAAHLADPIPVTMRAYGMHGTPSTVLIDRNGSLRRHTFGVEDILSFGKAITDLLAER